MEETNRRVKRQAKPIIWFDGALAYCVYSIFRSSGSRAQNAGSHPVSNWQRLWAFVQLCLLAGATRVTVLGGIQQKNECIGN
jgi:hypothetical protein